jgi:hypothetical protein
MYAEETAWENLKNATNLINVKFRRANRLNLSSMNAGIK